MRRKVFATFVPQTKDWKQIQGESSGGEIKRQRKRNEIQVTSEQKKGLWGGGRGGLQEGIRADREGQWWRG